MTIIPPFKTARRAFAGIALGIVFSFSAAHGAVVTATVGTLAPIEEEVLLSIGDVSNGVYLMKFNGSGVGGHRDIGQTFQAPTTGESAATGFVFQLGSVGSGAHGAAFTLNIFLFADASASTPSGPAAYTFTGTLPTAMAANDYLRLDLDQTITLASGQYYGVQLGFNTNASNREMQSVRALDSLYGNGVGFDAENKTTVGPLEYRGIGVDFKVSVLTIPEPSSVAFIGVAVLGGACLRLKSRKRPVL